MNRNLFFSFLLAVVVCSGVSTSAMAADPSALHPQLAPNFFETTPDTDIPYAAWDVVGKLTNYEDRAALTLPRHWRALTILYTLEWSHNIDGFDGFFTNSKGILDAAIKEDLPYVGATPYLKLFTEARRIFNDSSISEDVRSKALNRLDDRYYDLEKTHPISDYLRDFMKSHQALFLQ